MGEFANAKDDLSVLCDLKNENLLERCLRIIMGVMVHQEKMFKCFSYIF